MGSKEAAFETGWMTVDNFLNFSKHLVEVIRCSQEKNILITNNHEARCDYKTKMIYFKGNGIVLLIIPPHCSHKLQALEVGYLTRFKVFYTNEVDNWMISYPGSPFIKKIQ